MDMIKAGRLIASRRKALGLTQGDLGRRLHVTGKTVSKWERGESHPDATPFSHLATELQISVVELLSGEMKKDAGSRCHKSTEVTEEQVEFYRGARPLALALNPNLRTIVSPSCSGKTLSIPDLISSWGFPPRCSETASLPENLLP